jgi:hypothetical protein
MYLALKRNRIPVELHLYSTGGHGLGVRPGDHPSAAWRERCVEWLVSLDVLKADVAR